MVPKQPIAHALYHPVVVRAEPSGRFTAQPLGVPEIRAEAATAQEAVEQVQRALNDWASSVYWVALEVPPDQRPAYLRYAGHAKDDPEFEAYLEEIRRYREEVDQRRMLRFLLDTDHLTLLEQGHPGLLQRLLVGQTSSEVAISAITVEEALRGRLGYLSRSLDSAARVRGYTLLLGTVQLVQQMSVVPFDAGSEARFQQLRGHRLRVGSQDLKIAAVALEHNLTIVTRNARDFGQVPGLLLDDWST